METPTASRRTLYEVASEGITILTALCYERADAERLKPAPDAALIASMDATCSKLAATRRALPRYDAAELDAFIKRHGPVIRAGLENPPVAAIG